MVPPQHIIFLDIDGTVLELRDAENVAYAAAFSDCFAIHSINVNWASYSSRTDMAVAMEIVARHFGRACTDAELTAFLAAYIRRMSALVSSVEFSPSIMPGIQSLLECGAVNGAIRFVVATGNMRRVAQMRLERSGLWRYFDGGGFAEDGNTKADILSTAIRSVERRFPYLRRDRDMTFVGDQLTDCDAAVENQVRFIGIAASVDARERLERGGVKNIIRDFSDGPGLFRLCLGGSDLEHR